MQKKVYLKDLSYDEIMKKVKAGEKFYFNNEEDSYVQNKDGFLVTFYEDGSITIGDDIRNYGDYHIIEEVEEPEADESCIGKLCWFWDDDGDADSYNCVDILGNITKDEKGYSYLNRVDQLWHHCRPLSREEVKKLIKE